MLTVSGYQDDTSVCRSPGPHSLCVQARLCAAQPPLRAKGHLNAQHRAPNRCSIHVTLKRDCAAVALGGTQLCYLSDSNGGYVAWGGTRVLRSEAPTASGAWPFQSGWPGYGLQTQIHRGEDAQTKVRRSRAIITIHKELRMVGGGARCGPQTQGTWHFAPDNWSTKKTQPLRSHWRVRT